MLKEKTLKRIIVVEIISLVFTLIGGIIGLLFAMIFPISNALYFYIPLLWGIPVFLGFIAFSIMAILFFKETLIKGLK